MEEVELHAFGDASTRGVGAAVYAVVRQHSGTTQQLVAAKGRLAKQGLTIPRLELIAAHMATNLLVNVCNALDNLPTPRTYAWLDSMVNLHWMKGNGQYKQFVANRVVKIQLHKEIQWRHVPTDENPADLASSSGPVQSQVLWWTGPEWLQDPRKWPHNLVTQSSPATEQEARVIREVLGMVRTTTEHNDLDQLLERTNLQRALRVGAWLKRFLYNCRNKIKNLGPLLTEEIEEVRDWWMRRIQRRDNTAPHYPQVSG